MEPFALSLSKGCVELVETPARLAGFDRLSPSGGTRQPFDKLRANGL